MKCNKLCLNVHIDAAYEEKMLLKKLQETFYPYVYVVWTKVAKYNYQLLYLEWILKDLLGVERLYNVATLNYKGNKNYARIYQEIPNDLLYSLNTHLTANMAISSWSYKWLLWGY